MYIKIKVFSDTKKEKFTQKSEDHFEAYVKEPAKRNLANRRVMELVAARFAVPKGKVRLISGHRSPSKILRVDK